MKIILTIFFSLFFAKNFEAAENDSTVCKKLVQDFYDWYCKSIKQKNFSDFTPLFIESSNGFTTLDCEKYTNNLRRLGFSEKLIITELESYKPCIENLKKITYRTMHDKLSDISDYENIGCAFFNEYRWFKRMDPYEGIEITKTVIADNKCKVKARLFEINKKNERVYYVDVTVFLIKLNGAWKINEIMNYAA